MYVCIVDELSVHACRDDASMNNLRSSAYEAIMDLIKFSAKVVCVCVCVCVYRKKKAGIGERGKSYVHVDQDVGNLISHPSLPHSDVHMYVHILDNNFDWNVCSTSILS